MKRSLCPIYFTSLIFLAVALLIAGCPQPEELIPVPDVVGMTQSAAQAEIEAADLVVGTITEEAHDTVPEGEVISQTPEAGAEVEPGTTIELVVSLGKAPVTVPDLSGMSIEEAESALEEEGLVLGDIDEVHSEDIPEGAILSQEPQSGTEVAADSTVDVVVSLGPEQPEDEDSPKSPAICGSGANTASNPIGNLVLLLALTLVLYRKSRCAG